VAEEVRAALRAEGAVTGPQRFTTPAVSVRPRSLKRILDKLCAAAGVEVRLDTQIIAAHRDEGRIASLQVAGKARKVGAARRVRRIWPASAEPRPIRQPRPGAERLAGRALRWRAVDLSKASGRQCTRRGRRPSVLLSEQAVFARLPISGDVVPPPEVKKSIFHETALALRTHALTPRGPTRTRRFAEPHHHSSPSDADQITAAVEERRLPEIMDHRR
jgi:hypothetical protein